MRGLIRRLLLAVLGVALAACEFDAPPEPSLDLPDGGVYRAGEALRLSFSEPIAPDSLAVRVWGAVRDIEGEIPAAATPLLGACRAASPCGASSLGVAPDGLTATLALDPDGVGGTGAPLLLEVLAGLEDVGGQTTRSARWFDFQVLPIEAPDGPPAAEPIPFEDGIYVLVGSLHQPLPAVMTYVSHIVALDDGRIAIAGAEGDEIAGAAKNTTDPRELFVDRTTEGYTVHAWGRLRREGEERFFSSEPFAIEIVTNGIRVGLEAVRIHAKVVTETTPDGTHDHLVGTFAFEGATLTVGANEFRYDGGTTGLVGVWVPPGTAEAGAPDLCSDLCGAVELGRCEPPDDFPPGDFCAVLEAEASAREGNEAP